MATSPYTFRIRGLAGSFGLRMEGVRVRDVFDKSLGFRRPGYALSLDPGLMYARGLYTFSAWRSLGGEAKSQGERTRYGPECAWGCRIRGLNDLIRNFATVLTAIESSVKPRFQNNNFKPN